MKYFPHIFISCILIFTILVFYKNNKNSINKQDYTLDMFTDTVCDYVIITTIVNNGNNIGVSSIIVNDICDFNNNN